MLISTTNISISFRYNKPLEKYSKSNPLSRGQIISHSWRQGIVHNKQQDMFLKAQLPRHLC